MGEARKPAEVFSLADHLCDEMMARGWTTEDVAKRMDAGRDWRMKMLGLDLLMCVQDDNLLISDEMFGGLAHAFDVSEQFFRNLHAAWLAIPDRRIPFDPPENIFSEASRTSIKGGTDG